MLAAGTVAACVLVGMWGRVEATPPSRAATLATILESPAGHGRKLQAVEELRNIATSEARQKLEELASSEDPAVARMAISALGRSSFDGARDTLEGVYEDTGRSDDVRATALTVICAQESRAGHTWASVRDWVRQHDGNRTELEAAATALKARYWASEAE